MTLRDLYTELDVLLNSATASADTQVSYFDGSQAWDIEVMTVADRTGNTIWIKRKPRTAEQSLLSACSFVRSFLLGLETQTDKPDPLLEIRRRVHAPLIKELDAAIADFKREHERR